MTVLRDDRLLALHDLVEACRASAQHAALAAELLSEDRQGDALSALARRRNQDAERFCEPILEAGDMPAGPPEERGLLDAALASARATFAQDGGGALLADCRSREEEVLRKATAASEAPLRESEKAAAEELATDARSRLAVLSKA